MRKCELFTTYHNEFVQVEEIGGINETFMFFNRDGGGLNYRIQFTHKLFFKFEDEVGLKSFVDIDPEEEFIVIDSKGNELCIWPDTNDEFVDFMFQKMEEDSLTQDNEVTN